MDPLHKPDMLIGSVVFIVKYLCCCEERLELLTLNVGSVSLHCLSRHNPMQMNVSIIAKLHDLVWLVTKSHLFLDTSNSPTALKRFVCECDPKRYVLSLRTVHLIMIWHTRLDITHEC